MIRSLSLAAVVASFASSAAFAQDSRLSEPFTNVTSYGVSLPLGDTRQFIDGPSWVGVTWEGQWKIRHNTVGGVAIGVHDFSNHSDGTTDFAWGAATGDQFRDLIVATFLGTGRWYPAGSRWRGPYVGLGAGGIYAQQSYQLGVIPQLYRSAVHLAIAPEAGVAIPVWDGIAAVISARYLMPSSGGRYLDGGARRFQFLTLGIGLSEH